MGEGEGSQEGGKGLGRIRKRRNSGSRGEETEEEGKRYRRKRRGRIRGGCGSEEAEEKEIEGDQKE